MRRQKSLSEAQEPYRGEELFPPEGQRSVQRKQRQARTRRWRLDCKDLVYDGGHSSFCVWTRTRFGARLSAWLHYNVRSWGGGSITLVDQTVPGARFVPYENGAGEFPGTRV